MFSTIVAAEDFSEAKQIIDSKTPCNQLTDQQLEKIGDYYMEQMHPGDQHTAMENMMGGEGSDAVKQAHIGLAKRFYCGDQTATMGGMMGGGMMNMMGGNNFGGGMSMMRGYGMMGTTNWATMSLIWILFFAIVSFIFGIIFWWTYKLIAKK